MINLASLVALDDKFGVMTTLYTKSRHDATFDFNAFHIDVMLTLYIWRYWWHWKISVWQSLLQSEMTQLESWSLDFQCPITIHARNVLVMFYYIVVILNFLIELMASVYAILLQ